MVDVRVLALGGTSQPTPADQFTYVPGSPQGPTVTGLSPTSGSAAGGYLVAVSGTNFAPGSVVEFGTTPGMIVNISPTLIAVMAPSHLPGTVDVTVITPFGTSPTNPADQFTFTGDPGSGGPQVQALSPTSGPTAGGTSVTVYGTGFTGVTAVYFGSVPAQIVAVSPSAIAVITPAEPVGVVDVTVVTTAGTSPTTPADQYFYTDGPAPSFRSWGAVSVAPAGWAPYLTSLLQQAKAAGGANSLQNLVTWEWYYSDMMRRL
jgi:hypothetical protein